MRLVAEALLDWLNPFEGLIARSAPARLRAEALNLTTNEERSAETAAVEISPFADIAPIHDQGTEMFVAKIDLL